MNYWIIALPREDMQHCIKIGTFGLNRKGTLGRVKKGDKVACYITKENKIIALGEATSDYYMDDKRIFKAEGLFPDRFDFKAELLALDKEVNIKSMVDELTFITNKFYWSVYFRTGIVRIPKHDMNTISDSVLTSTR